MMDSQPVPPNARIADAIDRACRHSPFLAQLIEREPELAAAIAANGLPDLASLRPDDPAMPPGKRLRIERRRLALTLAIGDLAGVYDFAAVTTALSDFADHALDTAIRAAIVERTPDADPVGFAAIALGKQGSRELNYSSDIDPILIFDPATLPCRPRETPDDAAVRIGRRVIDLLQTLDADGYVLRVDLRLRPSPEITPIALSATAAISYYESQALPWERAAFIRARVAAGDMALGRSFLDVIQPFIWRRALDFGAIREIRGISRRIRDHHVRGQAFGPGYDLKRGRGGIREVEFFAQIQQLIHGGRDQALRAPATCDALSALAGAGWIPADDGSALADSYRLLRTIEHRVQMIDDRQTHALPMGDALDNVARLHGLDGGAALLALLAPHVARIGTIYDALEPDSVATLAIDGAALAIDLQAAGFDEGAAATAAERITHWRGGAYPALRSGAAREALEAVLPGLAHAIGQAPDPAAAILRLDHILARLSSAVNFFRLLEAQPVVARLLGAILSHAPTLADALGRRPQLLDGLIDTSALDPVEDGGALMKRIGRDGGDYQALLDQARLLVGEKRFALGAQIIAGVADPIAVARGYARVAEAAIEVITSATIEDFARGHGRVPDSELVILALGRLGGGVLTHASDLDLIFLFTGDHLAESDGKKSLGAVLYYNRLAQRVSGALSVATAAGPLYEVDTRLRPSGAQGPLAVSLAGFARYQRESAWTWEHMALTRARPVFGSAAARALVEVEVADVLRGARPARDIIADAVAMRADMAAHKPPAGPLDVKLSPGGLVDLEFAVHVVQLVHREGLSPDLGEAIDQLIAAGLLPAAMRPAHDLLTRLLVTLRLVAPDAQTPGEATRALIVRSLGSRDWASLLAQVDATRQEVTACWQTIVDGATNHGVE